MKTHCNYFLNWIGLIIITFSSTILLHTLIFHAAFFAGEIYEERGNPQSSINTSSKQISYEERIQNIKVPELLQAIRYYTIAVNHSSFSDPYWGYSEYKVLMNYSDLAQKNKRYLNILDNYVQTKSNVYPEFLIGKVVLSVRYGVYHHYDTTLRIKKDIIHDYKKLFITSEYFHKTEQLAKYINRHKLVIDPQTEQLLKQPTHYSDLLILLNQAYTSNQTDASMQKNLLHWKQTYDSMNLSDEERAMLKTIIWHKDRKSQTKITKTTKTLKDLISKQP